MLHATIIIFMLLSDMLHVPRVLLSSWLLSAADVDWRQCRASLRHVRSQGDYFYVLESGRASAFVKGVDGRVCLETTHTGWMHRRSPAAHAGSAACCVPATSSR